MLKRISSIIIIVLILLIFIPITKEIKINNKIEKVIKYKDIQFDYDGFLYIPKLNYKNLIKKGDKEVLDNNLISLNVNGSNINSNKNIILAGHNNKYVFHILYYLSLNDELIISDFKIDNMYIVKEIKYINAYDYSIFEEKDNTLTLITCTNDNQKRLVVIAIKK